MDNSWGIEEEFTAAIVWIIIIAVFYGFFKFVSFFANSTARAKGLDPNSPEGVEVAWKNFKWLAPLILFLLYLLGLIGRNKGWWGE